MQDERFIPYFQLCQWKAAVKLEGLGMKHSSGRSVTALVKKTSASRVALPAMRSSRCSKATSTNYRRKWNRHRAAQVGWQQGASAPLFFGELVRKGAVASLMGRRAPCRDEVGVVGLVGCACCFSL